MEKNLETQDDSSFTTQFLRKGTLDNDIPDPLVSLSLLRFSTSFWMFKRVSLMRPSDWPADWIWIALKEKKKKKRQLYISSFIISVSKIIIKKKKKSFTIS